MFDATQVAKTLLSSGVSSATVTWDVAPLYQKLDHTYIRRSPKYHDDVTDESRARARQRSSLPDSVPANVAANPPCAGITLRAVGIQ